MTQWCFDIEQFAEAQTSAAQDLDGAASGGVVELVNGGQRSRWPSGPQRYRDGFGEAWQVAAMGERPGPVVARTASTPSGVEREHVTGIHQVVG